MPCERRALRMPSRIPHPPSLIPLAPSTVPVRRSGRGSAPNAAAGSPRRTASAPAAARRSSPARTTATPAAHASPPDLGPGDAGHARTLDFWSLLPYQSPTLNQEWHGEPDHPAGIRCGDGRGARRRSRVRAAARAGQRGRRRGTAQLWRSPGIQLRRQRPTARRAAHIPDYAAARALSHLRLLLPERRESLGAERGREVPPADTGRLILLRP